MNKSKSTIKTDKSIHEIKMYEFNNLKIICDVKNYKQIVKKATYGLMVHITRMISLASDVCYHPNNIVYNAQKQQFIIPITIQYHNEEGDILTIINKRVEAIKNTISKLKFESNKLKFIARTLNQYKVDPFNFLQLSYFIDNESELISTPIELKLPKVPNFEIKEYYYKKGNFRHLEYIDPLLVDYGLYIGLSKPFKEMGYSYNALHIYEHMMISGWKKLNSANLKDINGGTISTGVCYLYNIHSTKKSLKKYAREYVKFHQLTKNKKYWKKELYDDLKRETIRTYSETQHVKNLNDFARTDATVYSEMIYNIKPFVKFSQDEFTILTVSPEPIKFKFDKYIPDVKPDKIELTERTYDYIPLTAIRNNDFVVLNKKDMTEEIYNKNACMFGIDCVGLILDDDTKESETLNTVLLFMLKNKIEVINEFMKNKTMPIDNYNFSNINVYCNYGFESNFDDNLNEDINLD
jgi:hypothetical protein